MKPASLKTFQVLAAVFGAFAFGRYSVEVKSSGIAWIGLIGGAALIAYVLFSLIRDFWKSNA